MCANTRLLLRYKKFPRSTTIAVSFQRSDLAGTIATRALRHRANENLFERRGDQPPSEQSDNPYQRPGLRMAAEGAFAQGSNQPSPHGYPGLDEGFDRPRLKTREPAWLLSAASRRLEPGSMAVLT